MTIVVTNPRQATFERELFSATAPPKIVITVVRASAVTTNPRQGTYDGNRSGHP